MRDLESLARNSAALATSHLLDGTKISDEVPNLFPNAVRKDSSTFYCSWENRIYRYASVADLLRQDLGQKLRSHLAPAIQSAAWLRIGGVAGPDVDNAIAVGNPARSLLKCEESTTMVGFRFSVHAGAVRTSLAIRSLSSCPRQCRMRTWRGCAARACLHLRRKVGARDCGSFGSFAGNDRTTFWEFATLSSGWRTWARERATSATDIVGNLASPGCPAVHLTPIEIHRRTVPQGDSVGAKISRMSRKPASPFAAPCPNSLFFGLIALTGRRSNVQFTAR
jgi:hypothetical protein